MSHVDDPRHPDHLDHPDHPGRPDHLGLAGDHDLRVPLGWRSGPWAALLQTDHPAAVHGRAVRVDRGLATVTTASDTVRVGWHPEDPGPVTGDWVAISDDRVVGIAPRRTAIRRPTSTVGHRTGEADQVLAANPDVVAVVMSVQGDLRVRRLERGLVLAHQSGAEPLVVLSKADLCDDLPLALRQAAASAPGVRVVVTSVVDGVGAEELRQLVAPDRTLAMIGASGCGKSSLTNAVAGNTVMDTGGVRVSDLRGRHTTTHRELVALPRGGAVLDTPGLRTLSLAEVADGLDAAFPDVEELAGGCRFRDCRHDGEPGCAVQEAVADRSLDADRLDGWRRIRVEAENAALRADRAAHRRAGRSVGRVAREAKRLRPGGGPR